MAILPSVPGVKVEVIVGGTALKEYDGNGDEESRPNTSFQYVEATTGSEFAVKYYFDSNFRTSHGVQIKTGLDGKIVSSKVHRKKDLFITAGFTSNSASSRTDGIWYRHGFRFSEVSTVQDSGRTVDAMLRETLDKTGDIVLELHFVKNIKRVKASGTDRGLNSQSALGTIPEKALSVNGLSHSASFSAPIMRTKTSSTRSHMVGSEDHPFARFIFRYRSLAKLKEMWIIQPPPTPTPPTTMLTPTPTPVSAPTAEVETLDSLSKEELLMLLKYRSSKDKEGSAIKQGVKRERSDDDSDEISVVEERSAKHRRVLPTGNDEVIELD